MHDTAHVQHVNALIASAFLCSEKLMRARARIAYSELLGRFGVVCPNKMLLQRAWSI